ncbi:MAG: hypothetical protein ACYSSN_08660 [Planctomycetota bacterium]|jgi:hypothetical protein
MKRKPIDYYDRRIEKLKATIRRLQAEKRVAILLQLERGKENAG